MDRRRWLWTGALGGLGSSLDLWGKEGRKSPGSRGEWSADAIVVGGSLGGCAAAQVMLEHGMRVILVEETDWIGGQLTSQGVPPDEHKWIESHGASKRYRGLRERIRAYYRREFPLTGTARGNAGLNPGLGSVSRLCHEPRVALAVLRDAMAPYLSNGQLTMLLEHEAVGADRKDDLVQAVTVRGLRTGLDRVLRAPYFVDATEMGDLLPLTRTEYITGAESKAQTGELHAAAVEDSTNQQAFTVCFAIDHLIGENHVIDRPASYAFWRDFVPALTPRWPGKLLSWIYTHPRSGQPRKLGFNPEGAKHDGVVNLWTYRRIAARSTFLPGKYRSDISLVNWPQNDYFLKPLIDVEPGERKARIAEGKQLSLSLLYWLQTEAPRPDGGQGYPGIRLRPDVMGTADGLAKYPYVRESRRILAETTVLESHCGRANRAQVTGQAEAVVTAKRYPDSVGIGYYPIDLHPSTGGDNYIDFEALPFQVPLGALLPRRVENLIPACKNIGTTHVTNGCYRLHPVEWGIGEAVGALLVFARRKKERPRAIRAQGKLLHEFQRFLEQEGVELAWPA